MQLLRFKTKNIQWLLAAILLVMALGIANNFNPGKVLAANEGCGSPAACEKQAGSGQEPQQESQSGGNSNSGDVGGYTAQDLRTDKNVTCDMFGDGKDGPAAAPHDATDGTKIKVSNYGNFYKYICDPSQPNAVMGVAAGLSNWLVALVGLVIVLMIIVGGVQMVASGGNPEALKAAKRRITNAIMSLIVLISLRALLVLVSIGGQPNEFFGTKVNESGETLQSISDLLVAAINFALYLGGALSVVFIIVGALRYIASGGNQTNLQKAKNTIVYAVLGLIISISAVAIVNFILNNLK